jgi:WD40 repeat protein
VGRTRNILLAANAAGAVQHWHMNSGKCLHSYEDEGNQVFALDYSDDGSHFCTGGRDCAVRIYDETTKAETHCMKGMKGMAVDLLHIIEFAVIEMKGKQLSHFQFMINIHN